MSIPVKCPKCGHVWSTKSPKVYIKCTSCLRKVKVQIVESKTTNNSEVNIKYAEYLADIKLNPIIDDYTDEILPPLTFQEWFETTKDFLTRVFEAELKRKAILDKSSADFDKREKQRESDNKEVEKNLKELLGYDNPMKEDKEE